MNKQRLVEILNSLDIPVNEGIQNDNAIGKFPRIVFWEYNWESILASDEEYDTTVTYQVSFFSNVPRDKKLIELRNKLKEEKIFQNIQHEYIQEEQYFHSFFSVEVVETIE